MTTRCNGITTCKKKECSRPAPYTEGELMAKAGRPKEVPDYQYLARCVSGGGRQETMGRSS
jgi:hypothetical protein